MQPFLKAAASVMDHYQIRTSDDRVPERDAATGRTRVTVTLGITGQLSGRVVYDMSRGTAAAIASVMMEEAATEFSPAVRSAIAELGNMISGRASVLLSEHGVSVDITQPVVIARRARGKLGRSVRLETEHGAICLHLDLKES